KATLTASITSPAPGSIAPINTPITFSGTFAGGVATDNLTVMWNFDALTYSGGTVAGASGAFTTVYPGFASPGIYKVSLTVAGGANYNSMTTNLYTTPTNGQTVEEYVVIYDPNGGFVTGGGWITSPLNALASNPSLTGRANFGFVSKYGKGANAPTGETEFNFQVGSFNFHSTIYDWLVVAGSLAQYKGSGTINGGGDYGFMLTAADSNIQGGPAVDGFRIKIYNKSTNAVIYDNKVGLDDTMSNQNTQAVSGGSIVVHPK